MKTSTMHYLYNCKPISQSNIRFLKLFTEKPKVFFLYMILWFSTYTIYGQEGLGDKLENARNEAYSFQKLGLNVRQGLNKDGKPFIAINYLHAEITRYFNNGGICTEVLIMPKDNQSVIYFMDKFDTAHSKISEGRWKLKNSSRSGSISLSYEKEYKEFYFYLRYE